MMKILGFLGKLGPWVILAIILALIVVISNIKACNSPDKKSDPADYYKKTNFKPDTVRIHDTTNIKIPVPYPVYLPPKQVKVFDSSKYVPPIHDTTYLPSAPTLKGQYDNYDRLIYGEINKDTLRLDLFKPKDNRVESGIYLVDFQRYKYQIINNSLRIAEIKASKSVNLTQKLPFFRYDGTYLEFGKGIVNPLFPNTGYIPDNVGFKTSVDIWRINFEGSGFYPLKGDNTPRIEVRAGIRLF